MFTVIYSFKVIPEKATDFIEAWKGLTELIYDYEGSLGSRLHQQSKDIYIAYAQWPNKKTWEEAGEKLPESAQELRKIMRESCLEINTTHELVVVEDLLKNKFA